MTPGPGHDPGAPEHARAETYLRLRVEAELRRVQALPRPDPLEERGVPAPLRGAVRFGQRAVTAAQPLAESAARTLQPLADNAVRTLQPLAGNASRTLQPLADGAARTLQPVVGQLAGTVLPAVERAARRLHPLVWRAAGRVQTLRFAADQQLRMWQWRAQAAAAPLRRATPSPAQPVEPSAEEGLRRLDMVAQALAWADVIDDATADSVVASLETALAARSRIDPHRLWARFRRGIHRQQTGRPPAGAYLAAPVGVACPAPAESGLANLDVITVVIAPDRAFLVVSGQVTAPDDRSQHRDPWPVFGSALCPTAVDDRGNAYQLYEDSGWSDDEGEWRSILQIAPVPPGGVQWLELTMSPGSAPIRVDLARAAGEATMGAEPAGCPAARLIDASAIDLLREATGSADGRPPWHDLSGAADIVTALEGAGALAPARDAVGRLISLADRLGVDVPPGLRAAGPPCDLPAAWVSVLENGRRRDGPRGTIPVAVVLPEVDGTRFVLAGLRSNAAGAQLDVLAWGRHRLPGVFGQDRISSWSWSARDDQDRCYILTERSCSAGDLHANLQLEMRPPLHPEATSLELTMAGRSGQVTATVPLAWREPL
jgi:hypothetical protein